MSVFEAQPIHRPEPPYEAGPFSCEVVPERAEARVRLRGELDLVTAPVVERQLDELHEAGFTQLVLDLRELTFMDSTGVRLLWRWTQSARRDGHGFSVVPGPPAVQRVLELCNMVGCLTFVRAPLGR